MRKTVVIGAALLLVQASLLAFTLLQERTWGGANNDDAIEVAFASDGSVFVAGTTETADGDRDAFLLKYGPDRSLQWERTYGTPSNPETGFDDEFAAGLAVAADDSVYVTGQIPDTSHLFILSTTLGTDEGQLLVPDEAVGGNTDAFTLWLQR